MDGVKIMEFVTATRDLIYAVLGLNALVTIAVLLHIYSLWRRLSKAASNGHEPADNLTFKGFEKGITELDQALDKRTKDAVDKVNHEVDARFAALIEEQRTQRKKMNVLLIIQRDIRAFMIYNRRPASESIVDDIDEV